MLFVNSDFRGIFKLVELKFVYPKTFVLDRLPLESMTMGTSRILVEIQFNFEF